MNGLDDHSLAMLASRVITRHITTMNTFTREKLPILKARFRASIGAIAVTLDAVEERTMFVSPAALEEAIGVNLKVADIRMLAGGVVSYDYSHVVQGEEFTWTKQANAEVFVCNRAEGLDVYNIIAINFPGDHSRDVYFQENCVAKATDDDYQLTKVMRAEKRAKLENPHAGGTVTDPIMVALVDTINGATKVADLKAIAGQYDEFATVLPEVLKATTAKAARELMLGAMNVPF